MKRRSFLLGGGVILVAGSAGIALGMAGRISEMTARDAAILAGRGEIMLFDIRTPAEWRETGVGLPAVTLDMHIPGFVDSITRRAGDNRSQKIALICARGGRSRFMSLRLAAAGFRQVYDVSEGMLGSDAGSGWIAQGLPLRRYPAPARENRLQSD